MNDQNDKAEPQPPVEIKAEALSAEALLGVIDNFVMREGTDYGSVEYSYDTKVESVKKQIMKGDVKIVFDPDSESVTLMTKREWQKISVGT
jgi:uncharacterized protein YheU (UPF0270 family)